MKNIKFYHCKHCGNMVLSIKDAGVPMMCCGEKMVELDPGVQDGAHEKHLPVVERDGDLVKVSVGSVEHPMVDAHFIQWVTLHTDAGVYTKELAPGQAPKAEFLLHNETPIAVYEYCILHGLWKTEF